MKHYYHLCILVVIGFALGGCFIQNFNKEARLASYTNANPHTSTHTNSKSESTSKSTTSQSLKSSNTSKRSPTKHYSNDKTLQILLTQQTKWQHTPYVSGGTTKKGADCSGFVMSVFNESFNLSLPRTTITQMDKGKTIGGKHTSTSKLMAGDLLFFKTGRGEHGYHVGIYLENGDFMHLSTKGGAKIANLSNSYWKKIFKKAVRYL
ncbi:NlpC/P60 family protein [Helicobacter fennelliae]|uniref:C40 family peptidase n=1 Tax=Helicobacter fennelliae TaxID=215 RepID=UPI000DFB1597|nr:NlpC/P60 family protein [Helicobacter fennelliae]STQ84271.1 NLP/P60 family lipoprotein [Helicobacter fennelliae]